MSKRLTSHRREEKKAPKGWPGRKTRKYREQQFAEENEFLQRELAHYEGKVLQEPDIARLHFNFQKAMGRTLPLRKFKNRINNIRPRNSRLSANRGTNEAA